MLSKSVYIFFSYDTDTCHLQKFLDYTTIVGWVSEGKGAGIKGRSSITLSAGVTRTIFESMPARQSWLKELGIDHIKRVNIQGVPGCTGVFTPTTNWTGLQIQMHFTKRA